MTALRWLAPLFMGPLSLLHAQPCTVLPACIVNSGLEAEPGNDMNIGEPYDVEGWSISHGSPTIFGNDAPTDQSGSSLWMWSYSSAGEGVYTCFDFKAGVAYDVCLWVRNTNTVAQNGRLQIWMVDAIDPSPDNPFIVSPNSLQGELIDSSWVNATEWTQLTLTVTPTVDRTRLLIFPYMSAPPEGGQFQYELQIDDVRVSPQAATELTALSLDAIPERIGWCDSTELCVSGAPPNTTVVWSPAIGLASTNGACVMASPCTTTTYTANLLVPATCPNSCSPSIPTGPLTTTVEVEPPAIQLSAPGPVVCGEPQWLTASVADGTCASGGGWRSSSGFVAGDSLLIAELTSERTGPYRYELPHPSGACTTASDDLVLRPEGTSAIVHVPNAFSPNGDGINDRFTATSIGFDRFLLTIYDRWGQVLFNTTDDRAGWDGSGGGTAAPNDIYTYVLEHRPTCSERTERVVGHVTVLR